MNTVPSPANRGIDAATLRDLAPTGRIRFAINYGNPVLAQKDPATGEPRGASVALAREFASRAGMDYEFVTFDAAGKVFEAIKSSAWDVAFLAIDPARATELAFTEPYVIIEGTYIVSDASPLRALQDFDRPGVRIAVGRGAAYDLHLTRALKNAELVRADTSAEAVDVFVAQELEAAAGVRQPLVEYARAHPGYRVIDGSFTSIRQAVAVPRARTLALACLGDFVEEVKANGFAVRALAGSSAA